MDLRGLLMKRDTILSRKPLVVVRRGFLSKREVSHLLGLGAARWKPSTVVDNETGQDAKHEDRTGFLADLRDSEDSIVAGVETKLGLLTKTRPCQGETIQLIRYGRAHRYLTHLDAFDPRVPAHAQHLLMGGQRAYTAIVCLKKAAAGGETEFPKLGLKILLRPGDALYWENINPDGTPSDLSTHSGRPVKAGEKIILSRWIRQRAFDGSEEAGGPVVRQRLTEELTALLLRYKARMDPELVSSTAGDGSVNLKAIIRLTLPEDRVAKRK